MTQEKPIKQPMKAGSPDLQYKWDTPGEEEEYEEKQ